MNINFIRLLLNETDIKLGEESGLLFSNKGIYLKMMVDYITVGYCSILITGKSAVLKTELVYPEHRGNKYLMYMIRYRLKLAKDKGVKKVIAHCTPMSVNSHIRSGAKAVKKFKNGITKVEYEIL